MGSLQGPEALLCKVKIEVQAEFQIDVMDYIPLAERRRMLRSGRGVCDVNAASRHVSPRILKDVFVGDLTHSMKPISSLFTRNQKDSCDASDAEVSHEQIYNVMIPGGRIAKVSVNATAVNSGPLQTCLPAFEEGCLSRDCNLHTQSNLHNLSRSLPGSEVQDRAVRQMPDSGTDKSALYSTPNFLIDVRLEPSDGCATNSNTECLCNSGASSDNDHASVFEKDSVDHMPLETRRNMLLTCFHSGQRDNGYIGCSSTPQAKAVGSSPKWGISNLPCCETCREDIGFMQDASLHDKEAAYCSKIRNANGPSYLQLPKSEIFFQGVSEANAAQISCAVVSDIQEVSAPGCPCSACQFEPGNHESNSLCSVTEVHVAGQKEACLTGSNQIPFSARPAFPVEMEVKTTESWPLEANTVKHSHSSVPDLENPCTVNQVSQVSYQQDNVSSRSCDLHENHESNCICPKQPSVMELELHGAEIEEIFLPGSDNLLPKTSFPEHLCMSNSDKQESFGAEDHCSITRLLSVSCDGQEIVSDKATTLQESQEVNDIPPRSTISEVKSTVFGQKRVQFHADNQPMDPSFSTSHVTVKSELVEECSAGIGSQNELAKYMSSLTSVFPESSVAVTFPPSVPCSLECVPSVTSHPEVDMPTEERKHANFDTSTKLQDSTLQAYSFKVKDEPLEENFADNDPQKQGKHPIKFSSSSFPLEAKAEPEMASLVSENFQGDFSNFETPIRAQIKMESTHELSEDVLDYIPLKERMHMLICSRVSEYNHISSSKYLMENQSSAPGAEPVSSGKTAASNYARRRKRKRTATDLVETALEEDAPGLLQVLVDKGINLEEIKLYGSVEDDEMIDLSSSEDSFDEFENVILKLFSERPSSLFKIGSSRETKGSKAAYCLACLISLIEQTRYMRLRNCPVEWGWCRDIQSFIFVFKKHNRIVLERPEYGYATYFFELVESLPTDWQIKRLVTAMKLTNYSRITLIENKSLMVGEDLTEGEARVLEEYGWKPNSGLGSLLNFCHRLVHDRRNEMDISEWRCKIGKLLMNGYDGGRIVLSSLPKKVAEYLGD